MSVTTDTEGLEKTRIEVTKLLAGELSDRKQYGESYEDVMWRLLNAEKSR